MYFKNSTIYLNENRRIQNEKDKCKLTKFFERDEREVLKHQRSKNFMNRKFLDLIVKLRNERFKQLNKETNEKRSISPASFNSLRKHKSL